MNLTEDDRIPHEVTAAGFTYLLEVSLTRELFEVFDDRGRIPTHTEKLQLLLYYAENDAYPDWIVDQSEPLPS